MEIFTVAFFGHRFIDNYFSLEQHLETLIYEILREKRYVEFIVGKNGEFDQLCASSVRRVKRNYRDDNSSLILVLPYLTADYSNNQESYNDYYDEVEICRESYNAHFKNAIQLRNRYMVDRADMIICNIEKRSGGAYQTIKYAEKKGKEIINIAEICESDI